MNTLVVSLSFANHSQTSLRYQLKQVVTVKNNFGTNTFAVKRRVFDAGKSVSRNSGLEVDTDDEMDSGDEWGI